jgi:inositol transport system substrate-binding protein
LIVILFDIASIRQDGMITRVNGFPLRAGERRDSQMLRNLARTALLAGATSLALIVGTAAEATSKHLTILASVPDLAFPFFVYMMGQIKDEANRLGDITVIESDGQRSSPKQSADLEAAIAEGVDGIVINPNDFDALAPALQEAIDSKIPAVTIDRRANVRGILAHVSADNVRGGEAQGELVMKLFPNGARVMYLQGQSGASPAIDRSNGLHNVLDKARGKYKFVFEDTAHFDRAQGLSMTESALAGMKLLPDVIVCANDDMALGALVALKSRDLVGKVALVGFDALPEALGEIKVGNLTATIEQKPGGQSRRAVDILVVPPRRREASRTSYAVGARRYHQGQCRGGRAHWRSEIGGSARTTVGCEERCAIVLLVPMLLLPIGYSACLPTKKSPICANLSMIFKCRSAAHFWEERLRWTSAGSRVRKAGLVSGFGYFHRRR